MEVGWYTTSYGDSVFLAPETVSAQFDWQKRNPKSVMLVFDPFRTILEGTCGARPLALHAYRLTPEFFALYKKGSFTVDSIRAAGVSYKTIFQEVPIALRPAFPSAVGAVLQRVAADPELGCDRTVLDTTISPVVERSIAYLVNKFDQMENQQTRFFNHQRAMAAQLRHLVCASLLLPPSLLLPVQGKRKRPLFAVPLMLFFFHLTEEQHGAAPDAVRAVGAREHAAHGADGVALRPGDRGRRRQHRAPLLCQRPSPQVNTPRPHALDTVPLSPHHTPHCPPRLVPRAVSTIDHTPRDRAAKKQEQGSCSAGQWCGARSRSSVASVSSSTSKNCGPVRHPR